jgi:hypothetical protein
MITLTKGVSIGRDAHCRFSWSVFKRFSFCQECQEW